MIPMSASLDAARALAAEIKSRAGDPLVLETHEKISELIQHEMPGADALDVAGLVVGLTGTLLRSVPTEQRANAGAAVMVLAFELADFADAMEAAGD